MACYHGFVDTVVVLAECPHVDVNWQDSEGNTALITAAQAGKTRLSFRPRAEAGERPARQGARVCMHACARVCMRVRVCVRVFGEADAHDLSS